jgi:hypothetical protein
MKPVVFFFPRVRSNNPAEQEIVLNYLVGATSLLSRTREEENKRWGEREREQNTKSLLGAILLTHSLTLVRWCTKTAKGKSVTELWLTCLADADSGAISFSYVSPASPFLLGQGGLGHSS